MYHKFLISNKNLWFILQLTQNVVTSSYVKPILLPSGPEVPTGADLKVAGFGVYSSADPGVSRNLRKSVRYVIDSTICQLEYDKYTAYHTTINQAEICLSTQDGSGLCAVNTIFIIK